MPSVTPYLFFHGNCEEALTTYAMILDAPPPDLTRVRDAPPDENMPAGSGDLVMHGLVQLPKGQIFGSDDIGGGTPAMAGCNVHVSFETFDKGKAAFDALNEGGEVRMPFEKTFWSPGFGALTDRFGIRWMIDVDIPA